MGWLFIAAASICEIIGGIGLHYFSKHRTLLNGAVYFGGLGLSLGLLYPSFRYLPVSVAYAVWTGIGTAGIVIINMMFFGESKKGLRLASLTAVIIGVVGLKAMG